ncbi:Putative anthrone oxygenase [Colletotrichum destructivum]|uniref:Anthrone oxygenase n=1 Tax=Colletotrichum destructivum TaxID=34406 RepID=A0AAX4HVD2_9PEZI|nr:Putative anthrone oxygenase [Colletotrichum destructivum]
MSSQPPSSPLRALQASTVFVNTALAGLNLGLSVLVVPRLLESPTPLMLRQWSGMFRRASRLLPLPTILCALSYWYVAYATAAAAARGRISAGGDRSRLLAVAGALCFSVLPWTKVFLVEINRKLFAKVKETEGMGLVAVGLTQEEEEGAKYLVDQWGLYNLGRSVATGLGGAVGLYATVF